MTLVGQQPVGVPLRCWHKKVVAASISGHLGPGSSAQIFGWTRACHSNHCVILYLNLSPPKKQWKHGVFQHKQPLQRPFYLFIPWCESPQPQQATTSFKFRVTEGNRCQTHSPWNFEYQLDWNPTSPTGGLYKGFEQGTWMIGWWWFWVNWSYVFVDLSRAVKKKNFKNS